MLKFGARVLSAWCVLNALPGAIALVFIALGRHAPGFQMLYQPAEIPVLDSRVLATVDGIAVLANALILVYCASAFVLVRAALAKGERWAFWVLLAGTSALQIASYVADYAYFQGQTRSVVHFSSLLLIAGFALCGAGYSERGSSGGET